MALTNRGLFRLLDCYYRGATAPTQFNLALVTNAVVPSVDTNVFSELTEIPAGNGYTSGGIAVARNSTDWDTLTENDSLDQADLLMADKTWTASGGTLPSSGDAYYAVLLDNNATVGSREVLAFWSLGGSKRVSAGQPITLQDCKITALQG